MRKIGRTQAAFPVLALLASVGCNDDPTSPPDPDLRNQPVRTLEIQAGRNKLFASVDIFFAGVREDSRCPRDVTCVWPGNAAVELHLSLGKAPSHKVTLNTNEVPRVVEWNGLKIRLVDLRPYPRSTRTIDPGAYVVELRVGGVGRLED